LLFAFKSFIKRKNPDTEKARSKTKTAAPAADSKKETKAEKKKKQAIKESSLHTQTSEEKAHIVSVRFAQILAKNKISYDNDRTTTGRQQPLVPTRFKSEGNYLWDRCKYYAESSECFYVRVFLECGKLSVGQQVFAQKLDEVS